MTFAADMFWLLPAIVFGPGVLLALAAVVALARFVVGERRDGRRAVEDMERLCALEASWRLPDYPRNTQKWS